MLSEYERQRLERIEDNKRMLVALGIETASEQCRQQPKPVATQGLSPRAPKAPQAKQRMCYRHAGLSADASEAARERTLSEAAVQLEMPAAASSPRASGPPQLTEEQRATLAASRGWLSQFETWLRGAVSADNANKTMDRVRELVSGQGVSLPGGHMALKGRAVCISDDLVRLKAEASDAYGVRGNGLDRGGWHLNHPLGKLLRFQQDLFGGVGGSGGVGGGGVGGGGGGGSSGKAADAADLAVAEGKAVDDGSSGWLAEGAVVEVEMQEEGLWGRSGSRPSNLLGPPLPSFCAMSSSPLKRSLGRLPT